MHDHLGATAAVSGDGPASVRQPGVAIRRLPDAWPGIWEPLGVTVDAEGVNVAVRAEGATAVDLCLFDEHGMETRVALKETTFHTFHGYVPGCGRAPATASGSTARGTRGAATGGTTRSC